ncbi:hypothetical protein [Desmospora profundinema]|uniref:SPOR domain-containing protein n=1 Tax=Desmospora profundinema TaxID=1571184 RepID=A0ABU1INS6_9BACL|nr:hypothetical protein [Desmospora profundinema]MDR6226427.1 hypothetical protein [Desmospora profundinema]
MEKQRMTIRFHQGRRPPTIQMGSGKQETLDPPIKRETKQETRQRSTKDKPAVSVKADEKPSSSLVSRGSKKWREEEEESVEWGKPYSRKELPDKKTVGSVVLSIAGAVLLGTLMGFLVLSLFFSGESDNSPRSIDSHLQSESGETESSQPHSEEQQEEGAATIQLPALTGVMVQGGTYREKKGAEEAVRQIRGEGWAAVMTVNSPYRLLLGVGINQEDSAALSAMYKENDQTVILKEHHVEESTVPISDKNKETMEKRVASLVKEGHQIYTLMAQRTSQGLVSGERSLEPVWDQVEKSSEKVSAMADGAEGDLPEKAKDPFTQMVQALDQVVQSGKANVNNPEEAMLWQIQEGLIRYALAYENFVTALQ